MTTVSKPLEGIVLSESLDDKTSGLLDSETSKTDKPDKYFDYSAPATYKIIVATGNSNSRSGTDSTVMIRLFGPNGHTSQVRLNDPDRDDFERNTINGFVHSSYQGDLGANIGAPYAIQIDLTNNRDKWELLYIKVEYTCGNFTRESMFRYNGWFADAGEEGVGAGGRWSDAIFVDGMQNPGSLITIKPEVSSAWLVVDNRGSDLPYEERKKKTISVSDRRLFSSKKTSSNTIEYSLAVTKSGGFFGPNYEMAIKNSHTESIEKLTSNETSMEISTEYNIETTVPARTLYFSKIRLLAEIDNASHYENGGDIVQAIPEQSLSKMLNGTDQSVYNKSYKNGDAIPDALKRVYELTLGMPFKQEIE
ncbi:PLAT/LH2 domain-containing protein [Salinibius halmophilus]|uniref:PLAT/LH2 domain-containing protein n=1 Tax=Salinibius halmophilus TaxID=1853216 RepID=UPI000E667B7A|nr:PLAT/LH2 domain-containing protein [Salinibius halmophilus]